MTDRPTPVLAGSEWQESDEETHTPTSHVAISADWIQLICPLIALVNTSLIFIARSKALVSNSRKTIFHRSDFPTTLDALPHAEQIEQCFGWLYRYFGVLAIVLSVAAIFAGVWQNLSREPQFLGLFIGFTGSGPILVWWEFHRRAVRTVLVPRGDVIGVYRRGRLAQTMRPEELKIRQLSQTKSIRAAIGLPLVAIFFISTPFFQRDYWPWAVIGLVILIGGICGVQRGICGVQKR